MLTVATANVNGIRAAFRRRMDTWIAERTPDVLLLQEVRAPDDLARQHLDGWHVAHLPCDIKGRAGVAVASRLPLRATRAGLVAYGPAGEPEPPVDTGRWVEADVELPGGGLLTVVSAYLHSGSNAVGQEHTMAAKYAHLDKVTARLAELTSAEHPVLVAGDLNIAHRSVDIANWKGNLKNAGFLPAERAYVDRWTGELGWTDLGRTHGGDGPGPYTWWSWRGQSYVNDRGWRIDYQLANPALAGRAVKVEVDRAPTYDERWSDHAAVVATYDL
ncbi:endonuclease/exonuclease/phosphatase family protein [Isoptericola sp. NEAU-Y5]|uniref:Endonuclease/exonuclease/phosphatase family protein n=1 Tax=Isoptericola luteus TaxID=2879484 RepID=A0ABS7ZBS9_9MICO|nr:exodeoxyribonuclease III [Isoptericola sp. NEAU-Y5]MCA5892499.1 endonuclease/exonuclease/phosphatase family protein [Isoptericola sp. NEAU-Y5]